jgi:predicted P-loop ATPase
MLKNDKAQEEFKKLPETKINPAKKENKILLALTNIEKEYGIKVEVSKNSKYKFEKAIEYLKNKYDFLVNEDTKEIEYRKREDDIPEAKKKSYETIDDMTYRIMRTELQMENIALSDDNFRNIIFSGYFFDSYHPIKDYLFSLPKWDGKRDYLKEWCQQVQLKDEAKYRNYFIAGFKKWFVALVMSQIKDEPHPYYINQTCLVFTGAQGRFKSTFFSNLLPKSLQLKYCLSGIYEFHNEEHQKYLGTTMIINLEELSAFNRSDIEAIKTRITQAQVRLRLKYGKADTFYKRRTSFCGTTNNPEFLNDMTGSRRFFVVPVSNITIDAKLNVDNIYAQALELFRNDFPYWFDEAAINEIEGMNEDFKINTMEEDFIVSHCFKPSQLEIDTRMCQYMNSNSIAQWLSKKYEKLNVNNSVVKNLGAALNKHGFKKISRKVNQKPVKLWQVMIKEDATSEALDEIEMDNKDIF